MPPEEFRMTYQPPPEVGLPPRKPKNTAAIVIAVLGGCLAFGLVGVMILAAILFPVFAQAREAARKSSCMSDAKQLSTAMMMYAQDHDETLPPAATWYTGLGTYLRSSVGTTCPSRPGVIGPYAFNSKHDRRSLAKIPSLSTASQLFESKAGLLNASDPLTSFTTPHRDTGIVAYADGHVEAEASAPSPTAGLK
jgi:prepilin-type processing-associated H-X9-DG protein